MLHAHFYDLHWVFKNTFMDIDMSFETNFWQSGYPSINLRTDSWQTATHNKHGNIHHFWGVIYKEKWNDDVILLCKPWTLKGTSGFQLNTSISQLPNITGETLKLYTRSSESCWKQASTNTNIVQITPYDHITSSPWDAFEIEHSGNEMFKLTESSFKSPPMTTSAALPHSFPGEQADFARFHSGAWTRKSQRWGRQQVCGLLSSQTTAGNIPPML